LAWHFIKYSSNQEYAALEKTARAMKVGLWKDPNPTPPWNWRKPQ
jgi:endonuclease YncB( thermonuclease family)